MFYKESEGIFKEFIKNLHVKNNYKLTEILVKRLAVLAKNDYYLLQIKAIKDIKQFTKNEIYNTLEQYIERIKICEQFEIEYADLIIVHQVFKMECPFIRCKILLYVQALIIIVLHV